MQELYQKIVGLGIHIKLADDKIKLSIPKGLDANEILDEIKGNRAGLISYLSLKGLEFNWPNAITSHQVSNEGGYETFFQQKKEFLRYEIYGPYSFNQSTLLRFTPGQYPHVLEAMKFIINRHESLRTCFRRTSSGILQFIRPASEIAGDITMVSIEDGNVDAQTIETQAAPHLNYAPDPQTDPLLKVTIAKCGTTDVYVALTTQHIISDEASVKIIETELTDAVSALELGRSLEQVFPPMVFQYKDYAAWVNRYNKSNGSSSRDFYKRRLTWQLGKQYGEDWRTNEAFSYRKQLYRELRKTRSEEEIRALPEAYGLLYNLYPTPGASYTTFLSEQQLKQVTDFANTYRETTFLALLAIVSVQFFRKDKNPYQRISVPFSCRVLPEFEKIIGWLTTEVIVATVLDEELSFLEFSRHLGQNIHETSAHRFYNHEQLMDDLDISLGILAPLLVNYSRADETFDFDTLGKKHGGGSGHFNYHMEFTEFRNGLLVRIDYDPAVSTAAEIEAIVAGIESLMMQLPSLAHLPISRLL